MNQENLFDNQDNNKTNLGRGLSLQIIGDNKKGKALFYRRDTLLKSIDLSDLTAKRLFVLEAVELGATKSKLAKALSISRQSIHNWEQTKEIFGMQGLINNYQVHDTRNMDLQRKIHADKLGRGNKAEQLAELRRQEKEERSQAQLKLDFSFEPAGQAKNIERSEQPYNEVHDWKSTRYAGVFSYMICLTSEWKWLDLVIGHYGRDFRIFLVFLLMTALNCRSVEQLKNVRSAEAGALLGLVKIPSRHYVWEWFYGAADLGISQYLLKDFFTRQIRAGLVSVWIWFADGHLLPYTGKEKVHHSYNTQRQMPVPGQTNIVTCDVSGRIVDFDIQEGKGDLRCLVSELPEKWKDEVGCFPVMVFDREGDGKEFFFGLVLKNIPFVTWEKNANKKELDSMADNLFSAEITLNNKEYGVFEDEKSFDYKPEDAEEPHQFSLRRICIWNKKSGKRTSGLSWDGGKDLSVEDCARAILSRWGASENTFKHLNDRHPLHYHPGFKLVESERQDIANPALKDLEKQIRSIKRKLAKAYPKLANCKEALKKDGQPRKNNQREKLQAEVNGFESEFKLLKRKKGELPDRVDVFDLENYRSFKKHNNEGKNLFDFVTCSVWNARKQMVEWLSDYYNNGNEVVDLFYAITDCHGWIKTTGDTVTVRIEPLQKPKRRSAQEQLCRKLTSLRARTPSGKLFIIEVGDSPMQK